jgi:predicted histidine transporter YuiF (NhaC family)
MILGTLVPLASILALCRGTQHPASDVTAGVVSGAASAQEEEDDHIVSTVVRDTCEIDMVLMVTSSRTVKVVPPVC